MGWVEARNQIVAIVEGTTPTTAKRGLASSFKHHEEASEVETADSRAFFIDFQRVSLPHRQASMVLPVWQRFDARLVVIYATDVDRTTLFETIALDHLALARRLPLQVNWNQPTSTIESLYMGRELVADAEIEEIDGAVLVAYPLTIECRET